MTFADDTSLCCRRTTWHKQEALLRTTLSKWGETIKDRKTKRLIFGPVPEGFNAEAFVGEARLLGGWFETAGTYVKDDSHRLSRAKSVRRSLSKQLPRFGLPKQLRGRLVAASVIRSLLFGLQCHAVSGATLRKWQTWLNGVARYVTGTRLSEMHERQITQSDVNQALGWWPIQVYVGQAQLMYLGHIARLPHGRPERIALFGWLRVEMGYGTNKQGSKSRRQLWARLLELCELGGVSTDNVAMQWEELACREGGVYWKSLVRKWCKQQLLEQRKDTWLERHKDVAARRRTEAAEERTRAELGARPVGGGKYACPHCLDPPVVQFPRSLREHIKVCQALPREIRQRQAEQRRTAFGRKHREQLPTAAPSTSDANASAAAEAHVPGSEPRFDDGVRRRVRGKRMRPLAYIQEVSRSVAPCGDWDIGHLRSLREKYAVKNPKHQMTLTDLPPPPPPGDWDQDRCCWWCKKQFDSISKRNHHVRACAHTVSTVAKTYQSHTAFCEEFYHYLSTLRYTFFYS